MSKTELLLVGAGGHAASCIDAVEQQGQFVIAGLLGLQEEVGKDVLGYRVLGRDDQLADFASRYRFALITVGQIKSFGLRVKLFDAVKAANFELPVVVSPHAYVSRHATVGEGTIVLHGAVINARASVGRNCIVNSKALVEHDARIGDHCHIATAAVINGGAEVGEKSFIGSNAVVRQITRIGARSVIGMGLSVTKDCVEETMLPKEAT